MNAVEHEHLHGQNASGGGGGKRACALGQHTLEMLHVPYGRVTVSHAPREARQVQQAASTEAKLAVMPLCERTDRGCVQSCRRQSSGVVPAVAHHSCLLYLPSDTAKAHRRLPWRRKIAINIASRHSPAEAQPICLPTRLLYHLAVLERHRSTVRVGLDDGSKAAIRELCKLLPAAPPHAPHPCQPCLAQLDNLVSGFLLITVKPTGIAYVRVCLRNRETWEWDPTYGGCKAARCAGLLRNTISVDQDSRKCGLRALVDAKLIL